MVVNIYFYANESEPAKGHPASVSVLVDIPAQKIVQMSWQQYLPGRAREAYRAAYTKARHKVRRDIEKMLGIGSSMLATRLVLTKDARSLPCDFGVLGYKHRY